MQCTLYPLHRLPSTNIDPYHKFRSISPSIIRRSTQPGVTQGPAARGRDPGDHRRLVLSHPPGQLGLDARITTKYSEKALLAPENYLEISLLPPSITLGYATHSSPCLQKAGDKLTLPPHPYSRSWAGLSWAGLGWLGWLAVTKYSEYLPGPGFLASFLCRHRGLAAAQRHGSSSC